MKKWLFALLFAVVLVPGEVAAQGCSICTKTASELGEKPAKGLNKGIVYLALLPLTIIGGLGYFWFRAQRAQ